MEIKSDFVEKTSESDKSSARITKKKEDTGSRELELQHKDAKGIPKMLGRDSSHAATCERDT